MNKNIFLKKNKKGSITIELLFAFAILIINITVIMLLINGSQSISVDTQTNNEALTKAQIELEQIRAKAKLDFNLVNPIPSYNDNIYQKSLLVEQINLFTKEITSIIKWKTDNGRNQEVKLISHLTNLDAIHGGNTCSSIISNPNGWKNPLHYEFSSVDFFGPNANGVEISNLDIFKNKLYITASKSPNPNPHNLFIFNLPNNASQPPELIGSLDNNSNSLTGMNAITTDGDYAYVANAYASSSSNCIVNNNCAQLQIIDIKNPTINNWNPAIYNLKIPSTTSLNKLTAGNSIFYYKGYVYIGLTKASGSGYEFNIIDVGGGTSGASPTNPILKGGYNIGNGVNSIFIKGNYAYIASPNTENLIILDISDPNNPFRTSGYTPSFGLNNGKTITIIGNTLYLGRTFGADEFQILDISNPYNISLLAKKDLGISDKKTIHGLIIRDYLAFLITLDKFEVWNISNLSNITPWSTDGTTNTFLNMSLLGGTGTSTNCEGDRIYVAVASSQGNNKDILAIIIPRP